MSAPRTPGRRRKPPTPALVARAMLAVGIEAGSKGLDGLDDLRDLRRAIEDATDVAVAAIRLQGVTWQEIADKVGITKQAAQQRWGYRGEE